MTLSHKNLLQEYCQIHNIEFPVYTAKSKGLAHQMRWYATVTLNPNGSPIKINTITSSGSKTGAEQMAAKLMLERLQQKDNPENKSLSDSTICTVVQPTDSGDTDTDSVDPDHSPNVVIVGRVEGTAKKSELQSNSVSEIQSSPSSQFPSVICLIDLENKPYFAKKLANQHLWIGFIGSTHHSVPKYAGWRKCRTSDLSAEIGSPPNYQLIYLVEGGLLNLVDHFLSFFTYPLVEYVAKLPTKPTVIKIVSGDNAGWCSRICLNRALEWKGLTDIKIKNIAHDE
jgi:hypothetical protein